MERARIANRLTLALVFSAALPSVAPRRTVAQAIARRHITAELVSELGSITPGAKWLMALRLVPQPQWHTYWKNAGDAGSPPSLEWAMPPGFRAGPILWPTPGRIREASLAVYGYEGEALFLVEVEAPRDLPPGRAVTLRTDASWVVCREFCIADHAELRREVVVSAGSAIPDRRWSGPLRAAYANLPRPLPEWHLSAEWTANGYTLRIALPAAWNRPMDGVLFFPARAGVIEHAAEQPLARRGGSYALALTKSRYAARRVSRLAGLLVAPAGWDRAGTVKAMEVDVPVGVR